MGLQFNIFQQIFLVAYSILYGVMLQTQFGFFPFPWGQTLKGHKEITGLENEDVQRIRLRILFSIFVLNIGPFIYGITILLWLARFEYGFGQWQCWLLVFITFWAGLGVFGFRRLYGLLAIKKKKFFPEFYCHMKKHHGLDPKAAGLSVVYYVMPPFALLLSFSYAPLYGFICVVAFFLILIALLGN